MSFMGGLAAYHMTKLMQVAYHMTRLITCFLGWLGVFLSVGNVQMEFMFVCVVGRVVTFFEGVLVTFYMAGLVSACFFSLNPPPWWALLGSLGSWWVESCRR